MAQNNILPKAQSRLVDQAGQPTREFYHFFNALVNNVTAQIDDLAGVIDNLANVIVALGGDPETGAGIINVAAAVEGKADNTITITGTGSLGGGGDLTQDRFINLDGDVDTPPGVSFYGSPDGTTKGWAAFSANFATSMDADDNVTLDLADLADSGTGSALLKITRDSKGRISGTSAATTTDLTEGGNLYFTNARADARITVQKGVADGLAPLGSDAKINVSYLPAAVLGQVSYQGTWDASAGTPPTTTPEKGWYYIVTVAGTTDLDGITEWDVGDWAIYNGASWDKIDNTDAVVTVNGYTGAVTLTAADVGAATAAQGALADTALQDAPSDGTTYGRKDGAWEPTGGGGTSMPPGYIDGLKMQWVSGTALTVSSGSAYIEGLSAVLNAPSAIAKAGLSLTASTWYHVYLCDNAGTPDFELSTTAPASPYNGTARSKAGDTSRRYVGSVLTDASGAVRNFTHYGNRVAWQTNIASGADVTRILANGKATTATVVSGCPCMPSTAVSASLRMGNTDTSAPAFVSSGSYSLTTTDAQFSAKAGVPIFAEAQCDSSQSFKYIFQSAPGGGLYLDVNGFAFER